VAGAFVHPDYPGETGESGWFYHDIAYLVLEADIDNIVPAMLDIVESGQSYRLVGYGLSAPNAAYEWQRKSVAMTQTGIGTYYVRTQGVDGTVCSGDGGAPLFVDETNSVVAVESNSTEPKCTIGNSVFSVRVDANLPFLGCVAKYGVSLSPGFGAGNTVVLDCECFEDETRSCEITNGTGHQTRECLLGHWQEWGTCVVSSCDVGYEVSGNECVPLTCSGSATQSCTISHGSGQQSRTCNLGTWSSWGACTVVSCDTGYQPNSGNTACVAMTCSGSTTQSCAISHGSGQQSRTCNLGTWSSSASRYPSR